MPSNVFYNGRESSTNYPYFLQNKPNLRKSQMNVNSLVTIDYENIANWTLGYNKPNSNPIAERVKLMQSVYLQRIIKKNADKGYEKTKPKQTQSKPMLVAWATCLTILKFLFSRQS